MTERGGVPPAAGAVAPLIAEDGVPELSAGPPAGLTPPTSRRGTSRFLSDVIADMGLLPRERVEAAVEEARVSGRTPEEVLATSGALTSDQLARATAERFGLHQVDLAVYQPDVAALNLIGFQAARRFGAVAIGFDDGVLLVAMADPSNVLALDDVKLMTGHEIRPVVASRDDMQALIGRLSRFEDAVADAVEEHKIGDFGPAAEVRESAGDAPVIKLVKSIIAEAVEQRASDVHLEPEGREMRVRFRVDGVLSVSTTIPPSMVAGVVSRVKIMADLDIAERRLPQDGRTSLTVDGRPIDVRVVTLPSVRGEGAVLRLLDKEQARIGLDSLGMNPDNRARFERGFSQAHGAVLVTGPTGSGKSTTLYAALNELNAPERNILTIEDPVEYQLPGVTQLQVHAKGHLTFATALRSMLRADPDVIMVGEIRDAETARIAVESALTGHLVLSTLHTNDAPSAIARLTEMEIEPFLSASAVKCVVAQRLVRRLCVFCKRRTMLDVAALEAAGFQAAFAIEGYEPEGCPRCKGSGYKGRTGVYEVMWVTEEIRRLTVERTSADEIRAVALEQGMRPLREDGFDKVGHGITSVAEVARVT
jgi:type IV pilus assembly protein PilB